jgi:hypothetical protein
MAEKQKKDKPGEKPKEEVEEPQEVQPPSSKRGDLSREQLEELRRKLWKKFH